MSIDTNPSSDVPSKTHEPFAENTPDLAPERSSLREQTKAPSLSTSLGFSFSLSSNLSILKRSNLPEQDSQIQHNSMKTPSQSQSSLLDDDSQKSMKKSLDFLLQKDNLADQIDIPEVPDFLETTPSLDIANSYNNIQSVPDIVPDLPKAMDFASMLSTNKSKLVRLSNGKTISLKPKSKSTLMVDETHDTVIPSNYGVNIKTIYQEMEHRIRMEQITLMNSSSSVSTRKSNSAVDSHLWAEKYRPKSFFDLVGNEKANRSALKWLRHWTKATFGEDIREELESLKKKEFYQNNTMNLPDDPYQRPRKKILLLAGPPGIGKTTIAHLMCKHLGYDTMEINASDERAGQDVRNKIHDSMDTHSFSGKPKCIIADEIDGASENGFVKVLIDLIYSDSRAIKRLISEKNRDENKNKKTKNLIGKILLRPIVAICNDIYAPVLEKLKPFCEIINFRKPRIDQIKTRLEEVVKLESKKPFSDTGMLSSKELSSIIEVSNFDIRSCLNLLQFNHTMDKKSSNGTQRYKDLEKSWFLLLAQIFKLDFHENKSVTFDNLDRALANSSASMDKIINGCFQKYPQFSNYKDVKLLNKAENISDWLYYYDIMNCSSANNNNIGYVQSLELIKYGNVTPMKFFLLFAEGNSSEKYSNDSQTRYDTRNFYENRKNNQYLLEKSIMNNVNMSPSLFTALNRRNYLSIEILPLINNFILNPDLNTTVGNSSSSNSKQSSKDGSESNVNFSTNRQKSIINHMINILQDFDFSIEINDKNTYNGQGFEIFPVLETLTKFDSKFCSPNYFNGDFMDEIDHKGGSGGFSFKNLDSSRQKALKYVFFEMEKRKVALALITNNKRKKDEEENINKGSNNSEHHHSKLPKNVKTSLFFTNLKNNPGQSSSAMDINGENRPFELKVWVKYHEGFSNAVRKNVTWDELWI